MDDEHPTHFLERLHISHLALVTLLLLVSGVYALFGMGFGYQVGTEAAAILSVAAPPVVVYTPQAVATTSAVSILFVGDMFFDRQIRFATSKYGLDHPFSCIDSLLQSVDFVVGNLEGPLTTNKSVSLGSIPGSPNNFRFTFPTTTALALVRHNVGVVSLGNNHIQNFGNAGITATHKYLKEAGVGYFGGVKGNEPMYRIDVRGVQLSFVAYNEFGGSSPKVVAATIAEEYLAGRQVVVFAHWGDEYTTDPKRLRPLATLFAQSGAVLVVGAHPHVVGVHEYIGGTLVYYSLGNFIFDQYFSEQVRRGLAVAITISPEGVMDVQEYPTELKRDGRTCLAQ